MVDSLLTASAERTPDAEALLCAGRRLTFAQLDVETDRVAGALQGLGVRRGDRVAIHLENSTTAVLAILGALRAGAVFVPINPTTKGEKLAFLLDDADAAVLVSDPRATQTVNEALAKSARTIPVVLSGSGHGMADDAARPHDWLWFDDLVAAAPGARAVRRIDLELAALIYTSGSTGRAKGVAMTHANVLSAVTSINAYLKNGPDDTILDVLPLSFDYGLYQLFLALQGGSRVVLERSFAFPTVMLELMARERVTGLPIVPMVAALLVRHNLEDHDLSALRYLTNTGAPLPPVHIAALRERLPATKIFSMYGLTECKRVSYLAPEELDARPLSVGKAMPNVEVYLIDDEGRRLDTGVGQLVVRGANVMQGYWRAPEETAAVLRPGTLPGEMVLHTGDIFRIDEDGYMYFQSRTDDVIKTRGQKVSPREVENVLHAVPGVCEAVVIGVSDSLLGQALHAYVTLHDGAAITERDILRHCARELEDFMVPRTVEIVASLPHTSSGKLSRRGLTSAATNSAA